MFVAFLFPSPSVAFRYKSNSDIADFGEDQQAQRGSTTNLIELLLIYTNVSGIQSE